MTTAHSQPVTRRTFLKGAGMMTVGMALAACAPVAAPAGAPAADAPAAPSAEGATINFLGGPWAFLPDLDVVIDEFAAKWGAENNVTINFERDAQLLPKIQTAIETGGAANIIQYSSPPQIFANALVDVTDIATELSEEGVVTCPMPPIRWAPKTANGWAHRWANTTGLSTIARIGCKRKATTSSLTPGRKH
ncbi:MAG: twin-arginine translocation signal domain-containing protein [Caldilineaceae bacterium]